MDFATTAYDGVAYVLYHTRKTVGTYMWMSIYENIRCSSMLAKHTQDLFNRTSFLRSCVKLTIRVSPCPTLAKRVIALGIYYMFTRNQGQVTLAFVHILAALHYNWPQTKFYESQGCKQTSRTGTHDHHLRTVLDVGVVHRVESSLLHGFVNPQTQAEVDIHLTLARIDAAAHYAQALNLAQCNAAFLSGTLTKKRFSGCHLRCYT